MKRQFYLALTTALFICGAMVEGAQPQDKTDQLQLEWFGISTLRNVRDVYPKVSLEIVEANISEPNFTAQIGPLTQKDLQNHLEQMLQKSGIRITNRFNATSTNAPLSLNVTVFAKVRNDTPLPAYAVFVYTEAVQPEILLRDNQIRSFSRTWPMVPTGAGTRSLLLVTPGTIVKEITEEVTRQVSSFIMDFSAANPSRRIIVPAPEKPGQEKPKTEESAPAPPAAPSA